MGSRIPLIIYGDGPRLASGLGRIARDLAIHLKAREEALGIRLAQVGVDYPAGWHWQPWDFYGFQPTPQDQGHGAVQIVVAEAQAETGERPIVLMIMDPSRCYDLLREPRREGEDTIDAEWWGYFPLDAHNPTGGIGGPAAICVRRCDRLLAYGRYGAGVLRKTLDAAPPAPTAIPPIPYLPHGLDLRVWRTGIGIDQAPEAFRTWALEHRLLREAIHPIRIGCVATNQSRKDLGLLFAAVADLKARGYPVALWLHTDEVVKAWAISELVSAFAFRREEIAVSLMAPGVPLGDEQLAAMYAWTDVTLAPGLGEGFGYPIVESLACGTPVVHGRYAGGVELIPKPAWLVAPAAWRLEGVYAVQRPVYEPGAMATALLHAAEYKRQDRAGCSAYCAGAVAHLDWRYLWPRWESWITRGLRARQGAADGQRSADESLQRV